MGRKSPKQTNRSRKRKAGWNTGSAKREVRKRIDLSKAGALVGEMLDEIERRDPEWRATFLTQLVMTGFANLKAALNDPAQRNITWAKPIGVLPWRVHWSPDRRGLMTCELRLPRARSAFNPENVDFVSKQVANGAWRHAVTYVLQQLTCWVIGFRGDGNVVRFAVPESMEVQLQAMPPDAREAEVKKLVEPLWLLGSPSSPNGSPPNRVVTTSLRVETDWKGEHHELSLCMRLDPPAIDLETNEGEFEFHFWLEGRGLEPAPPVLSEWEPALRKKLFRMLEQKIVRFREEAIRVIAEVGNPGIEEVVAQLHIGRLRFNLPRRGQRLTTQESLREAVRAQCEVEFAQFAGTVWSERLPMVVAFMEFIKGQEGDSEALRLLRDLRKAATEIVALKKTYGDVRPPGFGASILEVFAPLGEMLVEELSRLDAPLGSESPFRSRLIWFFYHSPFFRNDRRPSDRELAVLSLLLGEYPHVSGKDVRPSEVGTGGITAPAVIERERKAITSARVRMAALLEKWSFGKIIELGIETEARDAANQYPEAPGTDSPLPEA